MLKLPALGPVKGRCIDPLHPHTVNHLVVEILGLEEVVAVACDDGDVLAYYTSDIQAEIDLKKSISPNIQTKPSDHDARPFFHQNVYLSAWGLAVHTNARQIAVSSNTAIIDVFAFGLVDSDTPGHEQDRGSEQEWPMVSALTCNESSAQNWRVRLKGHVHNIPTIAFDNSGRDPEGRYLVSAGIDENVITFDIWEGRVHHVSSTTFRLRKLDGESDSWGWSVLCIDPATYWPCNGLIETFGTRRIGFYGNFPSGVWFNTRSSESVPDSNVRSPFSYNPFPEDEIANIPDSDFELSDQDRRSPISRELHSSYLTHGLRNAIKKTRLLKTKPSRVLDDLQDFYTIRSTKNMVGAVIAGPAAELGPQFDTLICTSRDIGLLYDDSEGSSNRMVCESPFDPPCLPYDHQRINMALQIQELGIIVVAKQEGRVAVLSLNQMRGAPRIKGLRIDRILPLGSQHVPKLPPMLGMALGPIEFGQDDGFDRTWRLMLYYFDHTILVYHIRRKFGHGAFGDVQAASGHP